MSKTLRTTAVSVAIALSALLAGSGTATATTAAVSCDVGEFCAWTNDGFTGGIEDWPGDSSFWGTMSDNAESIWNRHRSSATSRDNVQTYWNANYDSEGVCVLPDEQYDTGMDDNVYSSHALVHACF